MHKVKIKERLVDKILDIFKSFKAGRTFDDFSFLTLIFEDAFAQVTHSSESSSDRKICLP